MPKVIFTVQFNAMSPPSLIAFPLQKKKIFFFVMSDIRFMASDTP